MLLADKRSGRGVRVVPLGAGAVGTPRTMLATTASRPCRGATTPGFVRGFAFLRTRDGGPDGEPEQDEEPVLEIPGLPRLLRAHRPPDQLGLGLAELPRGLPRGPAGHGCHPCSCLHAASGGPSPLARHSLPPSSRSRFLETTRYPE